MSILQRSLLRYLHFADNSSLTSPSSPEYDKLGKIKLIIEKLSERFRSIYTPLAIDEAMIPFKSRSTLKHIYYFHNFFTGIGLLLDLLSLVCMGVGCFGPTGRASLKT